MSETGKTKRSGKRTATIIAAIIGGLVVVLLIVVVAIGSANSGADAQPTSTPTETVAEPEPEPEKTPTPTATPTPTSAAATEGFAPVDVTAQMQQAVGSVVTTATQVEESRVEVETTIADPRTGPGSAEAQQAIAVCEAALALGVTKVSVFEADGTTFVVAGHPAYGEACTEV